MPELGPWQGEEAARLVQGVAQARQALVCGDQVEQVAMLAGGGVGPFACCPPPGLGASQAHIEAAAWRVLDIADEPVAALAAAVRQIAAADRLGIAREAARQVGCGVVHHGLPKNGPVVADGPR